MKKILLIVAAVVLLAACGKEGDSGVSRVKIHFSPYEMVPMKTLEGVGSVCSRLDVWIIDTATADTLLLHQERTATTGFGTATAVLQTNRGYRLIAVAHNTTDTCTLSGGIVSFAGDVVKQTLVADTLFSPGDGLSLEVVMQRVVGMFKLRVADDIPTEVAYFQFVVDSAYNHWDVESATGHELARRTHTITGMSRGTDGYVTFNVFVIPDNLTGVRTVDITVSAMDGTDGEVETRQFVGVPIKAGYVTRYTGTFFITFDMGFSFEVGEWGSLGEYSF